LEHTGRECEVKMLSGALTQTLIKLGLNPDHLLQIVQDAIAEDLAGGQDVTSDSVISESQNSIAEFVTRKSGVIAGVHIAATVLESQGVTDYEILAAEGSPVKVGQTLLRARGNTRKLLLTERTALNFLGHLSGIATLTNRWVQEVKGTATKIRDTRKTTPLLREYEKFAVRMGGGQNHRASLSDAALIKDNHVLAAGGVSAAFNAVKKNFPNIAIEVEVDSLEQLREIVVADVELILLDNMSPEQCKAAVEIVKGRCKLEASGGITLENAKAYANSGVDYLAIGALTHSAPVLDIGLDLRTE
jgi:nicotinate-nucleotide pyrophosphorylase (carboxylating)